MLNTRSTEMDAIELIASDRTSTGSRLGLCLPIYEKDDRDRQQRNSQKINALHSDANQSTRNEITICHQVSERSA